jgi:hypothetical protein
VRVGLIEAIIVLLLVVRAIMVVVGRVAWLIIRCISYVVSMGPHGVYGGRLPAIPVGQASILRELGCVEGEAVEGIGWCGRHNALHMQC